MDVADVWLHGINVVTVANTYRPNAIYRDLMNGKMMPDRLEIVKSSQVSGECEILYNNDIHIAINPQRISISNRYDESFKQWQNGEAHTLAAEFVKTYSDVSYQAIGLNYTISLPHDDPLRWMTQKFLKAKSPPVNVSMVPHFKIKTDDAVLSLAFVPVGESSNGQQKRFVGVDCNHHYSGPFKTNEDILRIVMGWRDTRDTTLSRLGEVLELE